MKNEEKKQERQRKEYTHGKITQKMVNFRCDLENVAWLETQPNKGRAINAALEAYRKKRGL